MLIPFFLVIKWVVFTCLVECKTGEQALCGITLLQRPAAKLTIEKVFLYKSRSRCWGLLPTGECCRRTMVSTNYCTPPWGHFPVPENTCHMGLRSQKGTRAWDGCWPNSICGKTRGGWAMLPWSLGIFCQTREATVLCETFQFLLCDEDTVESKDTMTQYQKSKGS